MFCCWPSVRLVTNSLIGIWMLLWPVTAAVWGVFAVSRQSVILMLYILISSQCDSWCRRRLPRIIASFVSQVLDLVILLLLLMQPVSLIPDLWIQMYSCMISMIAEPVFMWIETSVLIQVVTMIGRKISHLVYNVWSESVIIKSLIILLTFAIYYFSMRILVAAMTMGQTPLFTHLAIILFVTHILVGVGTYHSEEGVITDSALLFMACSLVFYFASSSSIERFDGLSQYSPDKSLLHQLLDLPEATTALTNRSLSWVRRNYGWTFWFWLTVRMMACLSWLCLKQEPNEEWSQDPAVVADGWFRRDRSAVSCLRRNIFDWREESENDVSYDDEDEEEGDEGSPGISGIWLLVNRIDSVSLLKVMAVLIYSQQIIQRTGFLMPHPSDPSSLPSSSSSSSLQSFLDWIISSFLPMEMFAVSRLCQSLLIGLRYCNALHQAICLEKQNSEYY